MPRSHSSSVSRDKIQLPKDGIVDATVVKVPFFDPDEQIPNTVILARISHFRGTLPKLRQINFRQKCLLVEPFGPEIVYEAVYPCESDFNPSQD